MTKGLMIMKTSIILLASGLIFITSGCCSCQNTLITDSVLSHSKDYRETGSYDSLKWVETNFLKAGIRDKTITEVLGKAEGVFGESPKDSSTSIYPSERDVPHGHLLLIHFRNCKVFDWEWASE